MPIPTGPQAGTTEVGPLATASDLAAFGTFTDAGAAAAAAGVRSDTRWHIAPTITETLTLDGDGSYVLMLPTLRIVEVLEVRDTSEDTPKVVTGWRKSPAGFLTLPRGCWPLGPGTIEVDLTHGYEKCPAELLPVIAHRAQALKTSGSANMRLGSLSVGGDAGEPTAVDEDTLRRYKL